MHLLKKNNLEIPKFKMVDGGHFEFMLESYFHHSSRLKCQKYEEMLEKNCKDIIYQKS